VSALQVKLRLYHLFFPTRSRLARKYLFGDGIEIGKIVGCQDIPLDDQEIDFDLVEPTGMNRGVHEREPARLVGERVVEDPRQRVENENEEERPDQGEAQRRKGEPGSFHLTLLGRNRNGAGRGKAQLDPGAHRQKLVVPRVANIDLELRGLSVDSLP